MIHISGSIAYDRIMTFPGKFEEHILPEKLHVLNVSFMVDKVVEMRGGTAGNIAYNLALLGEKPMMYSSVGKDFITYEKAFKELDIPLENVFVDDNNFTASCYITTDLMANQIAAFSPAAMSNNLIPAFYPKTDVANDWAIVSPGNLDDMINLTRHYASEKTRLIADPGQQIIVLPHEHLAEMIEACDILIGNDYEISRICQILDVKIEDLYNKLTYIITTYGEKGSSISGREFEKMYMIDVAKPDCVVDPTGCGDSYRAGLLKGLHSELDIITSAQLASVTASFCVEKNGTQEHNFTNQAFIERYEKTFGTFPLLKI